MKMISTDLTMRVFAESIEDELNYVQSARSNYYNNGFPFGFNPQQFLKFGSQSSPVASSSSSFQPLKQINSNEYIVPYRRHNTHDIGQDPKYPRICTNNKSYSAPRTSSLSSSSNKLPNGYSTYGRCRSSSSSSTSSSISSYGQTSKAKNYGLFNKYADPSVMATSASEKMKPSTTSNNNSILDDSTYDDTYNVDLLASNSRFELTSLVEESSAISTNHNQSCTNLNLNSAPPFFDITIANEDNDDLNFGYDMEFLYSSQTDEDILSLEENEKLLMDLPLQNSNMAALNSHDTKLLFKGEFPNDDYDFVEEDDNKEVNRKDYEYDESFSDDYIDYQKSASSASSIFASPFDDSSIVTKPAIKKNNNLSSKKVATNKLSKSKSSNKENKEHLSKTTDNNKSLSNKKKSEVSIPNCQYSNEIYMCSIINSKTKELCGAKFSRTYDLTRHQNTIHAKERTVFRCLQCIKLFGGVGQEKTFSRLDALSRHLKTKHIDLTDFQRKEVTKYAKEHITYITA
ncbi:uncharacterized protein NDAI_0G03000 [Naumovozyma dairenensis CBS 421]|uniref:C2H2-type domain-containing protein n=1 Tax=Naumovozyma dairenensis (strain ATCC 10597 / BCRC 20456 / CBS 421 / NBRC 0211 / NRRL Y-12639) TaxID=1071378 RepID=G0WE66_NAUDC|nr:hypothetical protein NDAI_0G03000 [Naumovozyma dairenensis CBS 421]CCD26077.2 hypothetical protein NDAI_0G03000 [Naumovozyma dairenensis CBS 421]